MRIRAALAIVLVAWSAVASAQHSPFAVAVARDIYAVFPFDRDRFALGGGGGDRPPFAMYGDTPGEVVPVDCRQSAAFTIIAEANDRGQLGVGICHEQAARLRALMPKAQPGLDAVLASLRASAPDWREDVMRRMLFYRSTTLPGGSEFHFFHVVVIGHGVLAAPTGVLLRGDRAIVVQAGMTTLCERLPGVKLCTDTHDGFADLARRLLAAFP